MFLCNLNNFYHLLFLAQLIIDIIFAVLVFNIFKYIAEVKCCKIILRCLCSSYHLNTSVLFEKKPTKNDVHPTMKPVNLVGRLMRNSSKPGWNVLDLFGGSGSTLMAAEQIGRRAFLMELDEKFCDVIVHRWEEFTGKKAVRAGKLEVSL